MMTLSPTAMPDMEMMRLASNALEPVTVMPAILYSLGVFEVNMPSSSGLTETWAETNWL